jgi:hypothetical protein
LTEKITMINHDDLPTADEAKPLVDAIRSVFNDHRTPPTLAWPVLHMVVALMLEQFGPECANRYVAHIRAFTPIKPEGAN